MASRRLRSVAVTLGVVPLLAAGLTSCGSDEQYDSNAVCVDQTTQVRVDDDRCDDDRTSAGGGFGWYFIPVGIYAGGIGQRVGGGSFARPSGSYITGGVPREGATIKRGGFGGGTKSGGTRSGGGTKSGG